MKEGIKVKKILKGYLSGFISATFIIGCAMVFASNTTTLYNVINSGIKIVVDGQKFNPTDASGNTVEPFIYQGTTYLPVRAIANAVGKAVYWDGPNTTVYLGDTDGRLEYPTATINDVDNISDRLYYFRSVSAEKLTDNYGNAYSYANYYGDLSNSEICPFQALLNMKYSRFKCVLYVPRGCTTNESAKILIKTDGKIVYTSPEMTKTSAPVSVDIDITGCNDFQIECSGECRELGYIANAGFYQ